MSVYRGCEMPLNLVTVTVVAAGPANTGKTSLITRFKSDTFNENYVPTSFFRYQHSDYVGTRLVRFIIWDTSGSIEANTGRSLAYREADVFLLCYNISDPSSLFTTINHWVPDLRLQAPATPIILVGCQSDRRQSSPGSVSSSDALSMSQQIGAVMYVETSAKTSRRGVASAMEVATLTTLGHLSPSTSTPVKTLHPHPPSPPISKKQRQRSVSISRDNWDGSLRSNSSTLSSTRSDTSMTSVSSNSESSSTSSLSSSPSPKIVINTTRTPKTDRKAKSGDKDNKGEDEQLVSIKCQRLRPDKTYEEVEIQVPLAVYNTMNSQNSDSQDKCQQQSDKKILGGALGNKIKCLFSKTDQ